jgi:hypothetical protein
LLAALDLIKETSGSRQLNGLEVPAAVFSVNGPNIAQQIFGGSAEALR